MFVQKSNSKNGLRILNVVSHRGVPQRVTHENDISAALQNPKVLVFHGVLVLVQHVDHPVRILESLQHVTVEIQKVRYNVHVLQQHTLMSQHGLDNIAQSRAEHQDRHVHHFQLDEQLLGAVAQRVAVPVDDFLDFLAIEFQT